MGEIIGTGRLGVGRSSLCCCRGIGGLFNAEGIWPEACLPVGHFRP